MLGATQGGGVTCEATRIQMVTWQHTSSDFEGRDGNIPTVFTPAPIPRQGAANDVNPMIQRSSTQREETPWQPGQWPA